MSEKLCLQWNDFQNNIKNAFGHLRNTTDFVDVTLACEDGRQIEAHKVILAATSPFFEKILKENKHSHPLIYMRGMKSDDLTAIVDFLYFGETNVYQENLENFLKIAEELQLKGLEGSKDQDGSNEEEKLKPRDKSRTNGIPPISRTLQMKNETTDDSNRMGYNALVLPKTSVLSANLEQLDETVKEMMDSSENMIQEGNRQRRAKTCKVCRKEGSYTNIRNHIEANHLEGVSVPCNHCDKIFRSRNAFIVHISKNHKLFSSRTRDALRQHRKSDRSAEMVK